MLDVTSWRWPQWLLFALALLALASYVGLISVGRLEQELERLAARSDGGSLLQADTGRGQALFVVFAFLLLTPFAVGVAAFVPMFASAMVGAFFHRLLRMPEAGGALLFWIGFALLVYVTVDAWGPWVQRLISLLARASHAALQPS